MSYSRHSCVEGYEYEHRRKSIWPSFAEVVGNGTGMSLYLCWQDQASKDRHAEVPKRLGVTAFNNAAELPADCTQVLWAGAEGLSLGAWPPHPQQAAPTRVDFLDPTLRYRLKTSGKQQGLGRALGLAKTPGISVLDATAGLGRDALLMAWLGCEVTLLERSPLVHALLNDGLARALVCDDAEILAATARMHLHCEEARHWCAAIAKGERQQPDAIYLDPMFPPRSKSARVKKDMAMLQELLGAETDFAGLLAAARAVARLRVVVKRPAGKVDPSLPAPSFIVAGKTAGFGVYLSSSISSMR